MLRAILGPEDSTKVLRKDEGRIIARCRASGGSRGAAPEEPITQLATIDENAPQSLKRSARISLLTQR